MQTLQISLSLPDASHPDIELRFRADDAPCDLVIALSATARSGQQRRDTGASGREQDDYVLGGYAGI